MPNPATKPILSYFHLAPSCWNSSQCYCLTSFYGLPEWVLPQQHSTCFPCFPQHSHLTTPSWSPLFHYMKSTKWAVTTETCSVISTVSHVLQPCLSFTFSLQFCTFFVQTHTQYIIIIIIIFIFHLSIFGYIPRDVEIFKWSHIRKT